MCAETGHPERVPGDTRIRVYAQFGTLLPDHKSRAVPERAHKASASPLPDAEGAAGPQCPDNDGFTERSRVVPELHVLSSGHPPPYSRVQLWLYAGQ